MSSEQRLWSRRVQRYAQRLALALLLLSLPGVGHAEGDEHDEGFYFGGAFAAANEQFSDTGGLSFDDAGFGVDIWAGFRINRWVGVDAQFMFLEGFDLKGTSVDLNYAIFTANVKAYPLAGRIQPYAVFGLGGGRVEAEAGFGSVDESGGALHGGLGVEFYFIDSFAVVAGADYWYMLGDLEDLDVIEYRLGVQYQF